MKKIFLFAFVLFLLNSCSDQHLYCEYLDKALKNKRFIKEFELSHNSFQFLDITQKFNSCSETFSESGFTVVSSESSLSQKDYIVIFHKEENGLVQLSFHRKLTNDMFFMDFKNEDGELSLVKTRSGSF